MTTEERLVALEASLVRGRRLNRWLLAALGICLAAWVVAAIGPQGATAQAARPPLAIEAQSFRVVDEAGKEQASLGLLDGQPNLALWDEAGKVRASLGMVKGQPWLALRDGAGKVRAHLSLLDGRPSLSLWDEAGKLRANLTIFDGQPSLALWDEAGKVVWSAP